MKNKINFLISLIVLGLVHVTAEASRSRLTGLGQSADGSLFIEDARNIFLNPAEINKINNQVNLEWGDTDVPNNPKAEGGLIYKGQSLKMGAQLGRVGFAAQEVIAADALTGLNALYLPQNSLELMVGNDVNLVWGAALHYVNSDDTNSTAGSRDSEAQIITGKFGMIKDNLKGFAHLDLKTDVSSEAAGVTNEYKGDLTLRLGGTVELDAESQVGVVISRVQHDFNDAGTEGDREKLALFVDYFRTLKKTESDLLFYTAGIRYLDDEASFNGGGNTTNEDLALPVSIGLETKVKEWLTLRGSVQQEILINKEEVGSSAGNDNETNNEDDTVVAAGAGMVFGNLSFDATFEGSTNGQFDANNMFALIGMNYSF